MAPNKMIDHKNAYQNNYDILTYWGINQIKDKHRFIYQLKKITVVALALSFYISIMIYTYFETRIDKITGTLYYSVTQITYICKLFNYLHKNEKIAKIHETYSKHIFHCYNEKQYNFIAKAISSNERLSKLYGILILICITMYTFLPFIDNRLLPIDAWYPINIADNRYILIIYQISSISISALINSSTDVVTLGFVKMATAHFSIIKDLLVNLNGENSEKIKKKLAHCCYYHNNILSITEQIEDVFSNGILVQFVASVVILCITGFQIFLVPTHSAEFLMLIAYLLLVIFQVSLYCVSGHDLMVKSEEIRDACYMSEWTEFDPSIRKMLFIIMERAKRPVKLTAGKFFFLTLPTLVNILRSAYSYYTILRQVFIKNDES